MSFYATPHKGNLTSQNTHPSTDNVDLLGGQLKTILTSRHTIKTPWTERYAQFWPPDKAFLTPGQTISSFPYVWTFSEIAHFLNQQRLTKIDIKFK